MGLLSNLGSLLSKAINKKKEEEKQNQPQVVQPSSQPLAQQTAARQSRPTELTLPTMLTAKDMFASAPKKAPTQDTQAQLNTLTMQNMQKAKQDASQGEGWLSRNIFNRGDIQKRADVLARSRAATQYQQNNNYAPNAEVSNFMSGTKDISNQAVESAIRKNQYLKDVMVGANKINKIAQYTPVTGSTLNLGMAGAERLAKAQNASNVAKDISVQRNINEFGMDANQWNNLTPEQQSKMQNIRNVSYALAPLDVLGFGGFAKSGGSKVAKNVVTQLIKEGAVDTATKQAAKNIALSQLKRAAIPAAIGAGTSVASQKYMGEGINAVDALKSAGISGLLSTTVENKSILPKFKNSGIAGTIEDVPTPRASVEPDLPPPNKIVKGVNTTNPAKIQQNQALLDVVLTAQEAPVDNTLRPTTGVTPRKVVRSEPQVLTRTQPSYTPRPTAEVPQRVATPLELPQPQRLENPLVSSTAKPPIEAPVAQPQPQVNIQPEIQPNAVNRQVDLPPAEVPKPIDTVPAVPDQPTVPIQQTINNAPDVVAQNKQVPPQTISPSPTLEALNLPASGETLPAAPRTHDALVKELGGSLAPQKGKYTERAKLNIEELKQKSDALVANLDNQEIIKLANSTEAENLVRSPESYQLAKSMLKKLGEDSNDPAAVQTVNNIMSSMDKYLSKSGQTMRLAQEAFDDLPLPMKVKSIVKRIDSANINTKNYSPLADDPARAAIVEATITSHLQNAENVNQRIAALQGQLQSVIDNNLAGNLSNADVKGISNLLKREKTTLSLVNGDLVKYYDSLLPKSSVGVRANDWARRFMLSSFSGRVGDLVTTTSNLANLSAQNITQGLISKAVNLFSPGKVTDTTKGFGELFKGFGGGLSKTAGELKGKQYVDNLESSLRNNTNARTGLRKSTNPISRFIQASTEMATNLTSGVTDQKIVQLAQQEGRKQGLKGKVLKQYVEARSAVPSRAMVEAADQIHREINNLNENPVSRALNRVSASIEGKSAIGGLIKNQVMPFTSWLGGNIWNSITDKNVVASSIKLLKSVGKGDPEAIVRNLSKTANNAAMAYGLGYLLTQKGVITDKDAQGNDYGGLYFHIGDRYIPIKAAGFVAPNIILGNAAYNGINAQDESKSRTELVADSIEKGVGDLIKSLSIGNALGAETNIAKAYNETKKPGGSVSDAAATFGAGVASQFIPAITNDVNALLNNYTDLNPTREAANTRVTKINPETGRENKDVTGSLVAGIKNRIPVVSQNLPRKEGVAAVDILDRIVGGNRDNAASLGKKAEAKAKLDKEADLKSRGIPNPDDKNFDNSVQARIENGEYDNAIEALNLKLQKDSADKNIPKSDIKKIEDKIKTLEVLKFRDFKPEVIDLYNKTSLKEWRNMGDPENDQYDPETYQLLYQFDTDLAKKGVSKNSTKRTLNKYFAKPEKAKTSKSGGRSGGSSGVTDQLAKIRSNTVSGIPTLSKLSLGELAPQKVETNVKIPTIQQIRSSDLVKKRKITVGKA